MLRWIMIPLAVLALVAVACSGGAATPTKPGAPAGPGDPQRGRTLWQSQGPPAVSTCHMINGQGTVVGPDLSHVATTAATRKPGISAEAYIRESILDPGAFTVPGFPQGVMPSYKGTLNDQQLNDVVAYLETLK